MKTLNNTVRAGNDRSRKADYHIVEQAGRFKVYDAAGRFRLTFATREAAQAYIDGKHASNGHVAFQVAASIAAALFLLCYPLVAQAAPRCPGGTWTPRGCHYVWRGLDCYWQPGRLTVCIAPEARP